jgi:hypothetical protein
MGQIDIGCEFDKKYCAFNKKYEYDFDNFWRWKIQVEKGDSHILDKSHFDETYKKISTVLAGWRYPRGVNPESKVWDNLKESLLKISSDYDILRNYSLLQLEEIDIDLLQKIWNQLSSVKQENGLSTDTPLIVSIGKPLMLLWGQTTALDSRVRRTLSKDYSFSFMDFNRWTFKQWLYSLYLHSKFLKENPQLIDIIENKSIEKYKVDQPIPYGRFLDIYYF